jgi:hypothetical protein
MINKKIIIKEIDKLYSKKFKDKFVSEYIIYLMENDVKLATYTEIGEEAKKERINIIFLNYFPHTLKLNEYKNIIEEITNK